MLKKLFRLQTASEFFTYLVLNTFLKKETWIQISQMGATLVTFLIFPNRYCVSISTYLVPRNMYKTITSNNY
jgi:hypothetical protein